MRLQASEVSAKSCRPSFELRDAAPECREGALRIPDCLQAFACDLEEPFRSSAAFGCGIAVSRRNKVVLFESVQRSVDGSEQHGPVLQGHRQRLEGSQG